MFENLSERLERAFKSVKGEGRITELNIAETLKDVRRALQAPHASDEGPIYPGTCRAKSDASIFQDQQTIPSNS